MSVVPLRARAMDGGSAIFTSDTGRFFSATDAFLDRLSDDRLEANDHRFLRNEGYITDRDGDLADTAHSHGVAQRFAKANSLDYLILVPTLRCNLSCSYCQVSRAGLQQPGFDWSDETLQSTLHLIDEIEAPTVKIEFQGGEPTLRPDLIREVIERSAAKRPSQFVICTNLSNIDDEILAIFDRDDVFISTSLDGDLETHRRNRTKTSDPTDTFARNLGNMLARYGPDKISALPTLDASALPDPDDLIESYVGRGMNQIFLRPINFYGFARKLHADSRNQDDRWRAYYESFVRNLIERNWHDRSRVIHETYLTLCLNRVFRPGHDRHVDLRNPNPIGIDYVVIDYDGQVYPTDEARMLSRSRVIDLSIGDIKNGWDSPKRKLLNSHASNHFDDDCSGCAYQPFCGRDVLDDLARYGRIDIPRTDTAFCSRHLHLFDFIFQLIYSGDEATLFSLRKWLGVPGEGQDMAVAHS